MAYLFCLIIDFCQSTLSRHAIWGCASQGNANCFSGIPCLIATVIFTQSNSNVTLLWLGHIRVVYISTLWRCGTCQIKIIICTYQYTLKVWYLSNNNTNLYIKLWSEGVLPVQQHEWLCCLSTYSIWSLISHPIWVCASSHQPNPLLIF